MNGHQPLGHGNRTIANEFLYHWNGISFKPRIQMCSVWTVIGGWGHLQHTAKLAITKRDGSGTLQILATHCLYSDQHSHALFLPQRLHIRDLMFVTSWINGAGLFIFAEEPAVERERERSLETLESLVFRSYFTNWKCEECIKGSSLLELTMVLEINYYTL